MNPRYLWFAILISVLPTLASAEYEPPTRNWTLGYENGGVTLRRFLGDTWEVWLGGGPNDRKSDMNIERWEFATPDTLLPHSEVLEETKSESGHVQLGVGRRLLRDDRFWTTATLSVEYDWRNFQSGYDDFRPIQDDLRLRTTVGHEMETRVELGLRPAYDLTPRIVVMVEFGVYYRHGTLTTDDQSLRTDGTNLFGTAERRAQTSDTIGLYGYYGFDSISFLFRF